MFAKTGARLRTLTTPGPAWVFLSVALALHVIDEAANDFLSVYNPFVRAVRERLPVLPLPTFTFSTWITGLVAAVLVLLALSPYAFRRAAWMTPLAFVFSVFMVLNAGGHLTTSLLLRRLVPGTLSAPILLAAAICLLISVLEGWKPAESTARAPDG